MLSTKNCEPAIKMERDQSIQKVETCLLLLHVKSRVGPVYKENESELNSMSYREPYQCSEKHSY